MATRKQPPTKKKPTGPVKGRGRGAKPQPPARGVPAMRVRPKQVDTHLEAQAQGGALKRNRASRATAAPAVAECATAAPNTGGRPPIHNPELAAKLCEHLMEGDTLREACGRKGMPSVKTVMRWLHEDTGGFRAQYARAREVQAELDVDDQVHIADTPQRYATVEVEREKGKKTRIPVLVALDGAEVANRRLQADARRWRASKMAPKKYGSLLDSGGEGGLALVLVNDMTGRKQQPPDAGQVPPVVQPGALG